MMKLEDGWEGEDDSLEGVALLEADWDDFDDDDDDFDDDDDDFDDETATAVLEDSEFLDSQEPWLGDDEEDDEEDDWDDMPWSEDEDEVDEEFIV